MRVRLASILVTAAAVLSLAAAGCGGRAAAPPPGAPSPTPVAAPAVSDDELEATMAARLAFIVELADALAAVPAGDCPGIAAAIDGTVARNAELLASTLRDDEDPVMKARGDAWMKRHQDELTAAATKIRSTRESEAAAFSNAA